MLRDDKHVRLCTVGFSYVGVVYDSVHLPMYAWRSEVDIIYLFQLLLTLFESSSLREPEAHYLS